MRRSSLYAPCSENSRMPGGGRRPAQQTSAGCNSRREAFDEASRSLPISPAAILHSIEALSPANNLSSGSGTNSRSLGPQETSTAVVPPSCCARPVVTPIRLGLFASTTVLCGANGIAWASARGERLACSYLFCGLMSIPCANFRVLCGSGGGEAPVEHARRSTSADPLATIDAPRGSTVRMHGS